MAVAKAETTIQIAATQIDSITLVIKGTTGFICNRVSEKAKRELLLPGGRKSTAERAESLKHNPLLEYRASPYLLREEAPTRIAILSAMFKKSMSTGALDLSGARKAQIDRLLHPVGNRLPLFGTPQLLMSVTRNSDINHTPDIRTRAVLPEWCCFLTLSWVRPILHEQAVLNLLAHAGFSIGVGDWRPEKGSGTYGQFTIVSQDDADVQRLLATGGRAAQDAALAAPTFYDDESAELFEWYEQEVRSRYSVNDKRRRAMESASDGADLDEMLEMTDEIRALIDTANGEVTE